jgi:RND family efflux transporter MFP subunit
MNLAQSLKGWHLKALSSAHRLATRHDASISQVETPNRRPGQAPGVARAMRRWARVLLTSIAVFVAAWLVGSSPAAHAQAGPPVVTVAAPLARKVTQWDEYTGRFEPVERVDVRPRVSGYISKVHFEDGADVKEGDLLFTIDQRPFQIAVDSARADLLRAQSQVVVTRADYQRAQELVKTAATPVRELDQRKAALDTAQAQLLSADAALRNALLNLEWAEVRAPISGRVSDRRVDPGNLVSGGETGATLLTTIVKLDPIYFVFEGSEADYIRYTRLNKSSERRSFRDVQGSQADYILNPLPRKSGEPRSSREFANPVRVQLADETDWPHSGRMDFVDNEISNRSGTIRARAVLDNHDFFLAPGTFGRLQLYGGQVDALLIPDDAVTSDQARKVVYVVRPDAKIESRLVTLGGLALGLRVVTAGLRPDDRVVITGLANPFVRPGAVVTPEAGAIKPVEPAQAGG